MWELGRKRRREEGQKADNRDEGKAARSWRLVIWVAAGLGCRKELARHPKVDNCKMYIVRENRGRPTLESCRCHGAKYDWRKS